MICLGSIIEAPLWAMRYETFKQNCIKVDSVVRNNLQYFDSYIN